MGKCLNFETLREFMCDDGIYFGFALSGAA